MSIEQVKLPDVGGEEVEIIEICVNVGDNIEEDEAIIVVETEKASMDIPAPFAGTIDSISVDTGDKITEGTLICNISKAGDLVEDSSTKEEKHKVEPKEEEPKKEEQSNKQAVLEVGENCEIIDNKKICKVIEDVFVPDLGQDGEVDVIEILVHIGDSVGFEDGLITLETEKATMDVPAPFSGVIKELLINAGDKVSTGTLIAKMEKEVVEVLERVETKKETVEEVKEEVIVNTEETKQSVQSVTSGKVYASPSIRRLANMYGVDLSLVRGQGRKGRILREDIRLFIKEQLSKLNNGGQNVSSGSSLGFNLPPLKEVDFSKFGEIQTVELSRIQKISGPSLHRNYLNMPHVTQFDESDITELEKFRKEQNILIAKKEDGVKLSPLVFVLKAVSKALELYPKFNTSLSSDAQSLIYKKYIHIAVAVDTPNGLVVPVIRDVNKKGIYQLALELKEISQKARDGKLKAEDMQGACFTISSLGGIGGTYFTPIINAPEVAILGLSKAQMKPIWNGEEFNPRLMLPLSLSYDHKVIDGADGARFTSTLSQLLSDIRMLLL